MRSKLTLMTSAALALVVPIAPAAAQSTGDRATATGAPAPDAQDGDIVVTAQKRSERLLEVPLAVSALSADLLTQRNQTRVQDYFATVPGLNLFSQGNGQTVLSVRGLNTGTASNPVIGVVIDDVPFGSSTLLGYGSRLIPDIDPSDLSRIEVLRGPQGTLYGASSIGGLLKFVTQEPSTTEISGRVQADGSIVNKGEAGFGLRGAVNLPLTSTLAIRASSFGRRDAGYVDNLTTGQQNVNRTLTYGGRASLLWRPSADVSLKLGALYQRTEGDGTAEVNTDFNLRPTSGDLKQRRMPRTGDYWLEAQLYSGTLSVALAPQVNLTSVTAYGINQYRGNLDASATFTGLSDMIYGVTGARAINSFLTKKFSQEVRLDATAGMFDFLVGGFYTNERTPAQQVVTAADAATGDETGLLLDAAFPTTFKEYAVFGDVTAHFGERFDIQFGGRYSKNKQTYREVDSGPLIVAEVAASSKDDVFTYLVTPRFRMTPDFMVYARVASGYRAGGPNPGATFGFPSQYGADRTTNYEIGAKGKLLNGHLTYDTSLYYIDWSDIQITLRDATTGFAYFVNAGKAKSEGAELNIDYRNGHGLTVGANASINNARLTRDPPAGAGAAQKGDRLPLAAPFSGSFSIDQEVPLSGDARAFLGGTLSYVGRRRGNFVDNPGDIRLTYGDYAALDLRTGIRDRGWSYSLYVSNVTDRRGVIGGDPLPANGVATVTTPFYANYIRPRTYGVTVAREF